MARVGKAKRLRRRARLARKAVDQTQVTEAFRDFMAERGLGRTVTVTERGVTIHGGHFETMDIETGECTPV